jgi:hypothetical protein
MDPQEQAAQNEITTTLPRSYSSKDERAAVAELRKLEDFKHIVGAIFGPEGTVLANAKRRRGFLHDEDFEDIVIEED